MPLNFYGNYKIVPDVVFVSVFLCLIIISILYYSFICSNIITYSMYIFYDVGYGVNFYV